MKNLKKVLSLVLALAMAMSLMTAAFAKDASDYADYDKVANKDAVSMLTALNVIDGKNGNFDPAGNVTRGEMAKMITLISLGNVDVTSFKGTTTDLKDVNGHWAEGYIKYCYSQGIIGGYGNGLFKANNNVTAVEASKMLLTALGYNAKVQGYTGAQWKLNVVRDAQLSGLYKGVAVAADKVLTRDEAAQMMYNTVKANSVRKVPSINAITGEQTYTYYADGDPLLKSNFKAVEYVGVMGAVTYADSNKEYTYAGTYNDSKNNSYGSAVKSKTDYSALEGEEVSVVVANQGTKDEAVLGISATGKSVVVNANVSGLKMDGAKLKVNGVKYELESGLTVTANKNSYDTIKLIDKDGNGKLDTQVVTTVKAEKVTYVSSKEIIAGGTTYKLADNNVEAGLAKKDYVTIVANTDGSFDIAKVAKVAGKVDAIDGTKARVGGNWYEVNNEGTDLALKNDVEFYAVNGVVVASSAEVISGASINNLVMVLNKTSGLLTNQAVVMDATGAQKTVNIDTAGANPTLGALYTFEESDKGYKFTAAATTGDYTWVPQSAGVTTTGATVEKIEGNEIADTAVIFVFGATDNSGKVITGKQLKNLAINTTDGTVNTTGFGAYTSETNGLTRVTYAGVKTTKVEELGITSGNDNYAYVTDASIAVVNGDKEYRQYQIWTGSENVTVQEKGTNARAVGAVLVYDAITDGIITGVKPVTVQAAAAANTTFAAYVQGIDGKNIYLDGVADDNKYKLTKDTVYMYVDSNADKAENIGLADGEGVVLADKYGDGNIYMDNVIVKANSSKEIELVIIDAKNNMTVAGVNNDKTATIKASIVTNANAALDVTAGIKAGDAIVVTFTATNAVSTATVNVTNAKLADGTTTISVPAMAKDAVFSVTIFATGAGNVSFA